MVIGSVFVCAACAGPVSRPPQLPEAEVKAEQRTEQIAQIRDYFAQLHLIDTVAFRIRTANKADCKKWVSAQIGLYAVTPQSLPRKYRSFAREALNLTWARPTVISVVDGSPAAQAGIVKGDEIIALNGELIPVTGTAGWMGAWLKHNGVKPVRADLRNDGVDRTVIVTPVMACAIPISYVTADEVNAETDGDKIVISSSILRVAKTEAQLALIVGHELAHVNLGHLQKQQFNRVLSFVGGAMVDTSFLVGGISTGGVFTHEFQKAGRKRSASASTARPTMSAPITPHARATSLPAPKRCGARCPCSVPTASASPRRIPRRRCVSCRCRRWRPKLPTRRAVDCRSTRS
ncbi:MAG TPA: M48 family metallopeptidase [Pseudolabrys sp.]|jgi:hypothetical protein